MATGFELRIARLARRLRAAEVAQQAGLSPFTLSRLENERMPLHPDVEARLKQVIGWGPHFERFFAALAAETAPPRPADGGGHDEEPPAARRLA